ncbi:hypothetical protein TNCV_5140091 [Trichonephila clavipes]|nr:hypothetical protein TNCV_5140091 [Trichonephila clavipes]
MSVSSQLQPILLMSTCFITMESQCPSICSLPRFPRDYRSRSDCLTVKHAGQTSKPKYFFIQMPNIARSSSGTPPVTQECASGIPFLREGKFNQLARGNMGLRCKGAEQIKNFQERGLFAMVPRERRCRNSKRHLRWNLSQPRA